VSRKIVPQEPKQKNWLVSGDKLGGNKSVGASKHGLAQEKFSQPALAKITRTWKKKQGC